MKNIIYIFLFLFAFTTACKTGKTIKTTNIPTVVQSQEKLLFKELLESDLYLGMPKAEFLENRPNAAYNSDAHDFRSIYVEENFSDRFETLICYIDNDNEAPLYEFILILNPKLNANDVAYEQFGLPNYKNKEWRFPTAETNLPYTIAVWTYNNKIIIAATLKGTEWEDGIE